MFSRLISVSMLVFSLLALCACNASSVREEYAKDGSITAREYNGGDPSYAQYVAAMTSQQSKAPLVDASACAGDARCVEHVAALAALASAGRGNGPVIQPPAPKRTWGDRLESITKTSISALPGLGGIYASIESSKHQRHEREALYGTFGGIVTDVATLGAAPTYQVGGDYIGGDRTETNTTVGGNLGDTQTIGGNLGDTQTIGRDQIGGDRIDNGGVIGDDNDTRFGSDGPFDDDHSDPGDDCTGDCSTQPVEPAP